MSLWNFYKAWERSIDNDLLVFDSINKNNYHINSIPIELWDSEVIAFYFENNNLIVRVK